MASVSCIFGLGLPEEYLAAKLVIDTCQSYDISDISHKLINIMYGNIPTVDNDIYKTLQSIKRGEFAILSNTSHHIKQLCNNDDLDDNFIHSDLTELSYTTADSSKEQYVIVWPPYENDPIVLCFGNGKSTSMMHTTSSWTPTSIYIAKTIIVDNSNCSIDNNNDNGKGNDKLSNSTHQLNKDKNNNNNNRKRETKTFEILPYHDTNRYNSQQQLSIYPAKHFVTNPNQMLAVCSSIEEELDIRCQELLQSGNLVAMDRLMTRVTRDLALLRSTGYCPGIENYSRHFSGRGEGEPPSTMLDYFHSIPHPSEGRTVGMSMTNSVSDEWLLFVDESHITVPQIRAMYAGDRARKQKLVDYGFRLPSALDNRPLTEQEFWSKVSRAVYVSATPGREELEQSTTVVSMTVRPTYILDPLVHVRPIEGQLEDLCQEIRKRITRREKSLVMTLTKRDAEDTTSWLLDLNIRCAYLHSELNTVQRAEVLQKMQEDQLDVIVGVNLLREGLDLPQVQYEIKF